MNGPGRMPPYQEKSESAPAAPLNHIAGQGSSDACKDKPATFKSDTTSQLSSISGMASPERTATALRNPGPISDIEAKHYYYGLYSKPVLIARTGNNAWEEPTGPEAYLLPKELRTVGNHPLQEVWEDELSDRMHKILEREGVRWTSTDVARIGFVAESWAPVCIWIGVEPNTLSREDGFNIAQECKKLLVANNIHDVEVEIRESVVTRYNGPRLLKPVHSFNPAAQLVEPLTSTLGLFICNRSTTWIEGTGGFYVTDTDSNLYLVTARHVLFNSEQDSNELYSKHPNQPRKDVALFGVARFNKYLKEIKSAIDSKKVLINYLERRVLHAMEGSDGMGVSFMLWKVVMEWAWPKQSRRLLWQGGR